MARANTMPAGTQSTRKAKDADVVVGNGIAILGAGAAITLAVIGLLTGFDMIDVVRPFETGLLWLGTALTVALCANVFRREHHVVDSDSGGYPPQSGRPLSGGAESNPDFYADSPRQMSRGTSELDQDTDKQSYDSTATRVSDSARTTTKRGMSDVDPDLDQRNIDPDAIERNLPNDRLQ